MWLREFRLWNEYTATGISMVANSLILFLALTERNSTLRSYSPMIVVSVFMDYIFCVGSLLTIMNAVIKDGVFIMITDGILRHLCPTGHFVLAAIHIFIVGAATTIIPVDYYFRYCLVCRKQEPSIWRLIRSLCLAVGAIVFGAFLFGYAFSKTSAEQLSQFGRIAETELWRDGNGTIPRFVAADSSNPWFVAALLVSGLIATVSYLIAAVLGTLIYKDLNTLRSVVSKRTQRMQRSVSWVLIIKAVVPYCFSTTPALFVLISLFFKWNIPNFGFWLVIVNTWIPVISPLSTLLLLSGYRRRIVQSVRTSSIVRLGKPNRTSLHSKTSLQT